MEHFPSRESPESLPPQYLLLKEQLLSGTLSLKEIKNSLVRFDQETPMRDASDDNLLFLYDPQVVEYISDHSETENEYYWLLCFTEFHVAQRLAIIGSDDALTHLEKAAEYVQRPEVIPEWRAYVEATLLYLEGKMIPEYLINETRSGRNTQILQNFNKGLSSRGAPSYAEDYSK